MPAVARTLSAKPGETASHGSHSSSAVTATPSARTPRSRPLPPSPSSATVPIAAARTTLGSVRASSTKPTIPSDRQQVLPPPAHPAPAPDQHQEADHQREVGPRHGEQVGQPGGAEVRLHLLGNGVVVAGHQGRHQRGLGAVPTGGSVADRRADHRRTAPPHRRHGRRRRLPQRGQHRGQVVVVRRRQPGPQRDRAAQTHPSPRVVADHQHRRPGLHPAPARLEQPQPPAQHHPVAVLAGDRTRVGGDHQLRLHRDPAGRQGGHRTGGHVRVPQQRGAADRGRDHEPGRRGAQRSPARPRPVVRRSRRAGRAAPGPRPPGSPAEAPATPAGHQPTRRHRRPASAGHGGARRREARPRLTPSPAARGRPGSSRRCRRRRAAGRRTGSRRCRCASPRSPGRSPGRPRAARRARRARRC